MFYKKEIGKIGEDIAEKYLIKKGYCIIKRNFNCKQGEIDIIARDKKEIVFIEVKTRKNTKYGNPAEAVNYFKQEHFRKATQLYIHMNKLDSNFIRFDVIEIIYGDKKTKINHIKQAIDY